MDVQMFCKDGGGITTSGGSKVTQCGMDWEVCCLQVNPAYDIMGFLFWVPMTMPVHRLSFLEALLVGTNHDTGNIPQKISQKKK